MSPKLVEHLKALYGPDAAARTVPEMQALLDRSIPLRQQGAAPVSPAALTQRDALLITYADQLREDGVAPLQTLAAFCDAYLADTIPGVHLLPFYPSSSDDGFAVKDYFAVDPACGTWADLHQLGRRFELMFDGVFNHMSAQSEWFQRFLAGDPVFRGFFVTVEGHPDLSSVVRPRALPLLTEFPTAFGRQQVWTTFSADQVDLNFRNPAVLLRVVEALLFYVTQGARYLRLDAIAFLWKEIGTTCLHRPQTHRIIQLLRALLDEVAPHVLLITETNVPHRDNVSYFGDGTNEAQLVYNFALPPLVLHSLATGNAEKLTRWAQALSLPSDRVTFLNFLASHDGIGLNPVRGILSDAEIEALVARARAHGGFVSDKVQPDGSRLPYELNINYLDALSNPAAAEPVELTARRFLTAHAILLSLQGMPGIYFHSLFGSRGDRLGAETSGLARRINRQKLERVGLEAELGDAGSLRARILAGQRELLRIRRLHEAFAPNSPQRVLDLDARVFALLRQSGDGADTVLCLHNISPAGIRVRLQGILPGGDGWEPLWGCGPRAATGGVLVLKPGASAWLAAVRPSD
jgi:glucosylglycerate phosphorylase